MNKSSQFPIPPTATTPLAVTMFRPGAFSSCSWHPTTSHAFAAACRSAFPFCDYREHRSFRPSCASRSIPSCDIPPVAVGRGREQCLSCCRRSQCGQTPVPRPRPPPDTTGHARSEQEMAHPPVRRRADETNDEAGRPGHGTGGR